MFKDEYLLDYVNTEELFVRDKDRDERLIEQGIINNVKNFIMTFGKDFTFVGNQYHLSSRPNEVSGEISPCATLSRDEKEDCEDKGIIRLRGI